MREGLRLIGLGFLVLCFTGALAAAVPWRPLALDGLTPLVAWMAVRTRLPEGILPVIVVGMMADAFSVGGAGLYPFALTMGYLLGRYILINMACLFWWQKALLVFFTAGVVKLLLFLFSGSLELLDLEGVVDLVVTSLLGPLWFRLFEWTALREVTGEES